MQSLLDIRLQLNQTVCYPIRDVPVSIKSAGRVLTVLELLPHCIGNRAALGRDPYHVLVSFTSFLAITDEHDRSTDETGVPDETAGVPHRTGSAPQKF